MLNETRCASCGVLVPPEPEGVTVFCSARCYGRSVARAQALVACPNDCGDHCAPDRVIRPVPTADTEASS